MKFQLKISLSYSTAVYETVYDPDMLINFVETLRECDFERFEMLAGNMIRPFPNNYTFTKACAEQLITKFASDMNIAIVRPSIIGTAWNEPLPGYTDNVSLVFYFGNYTYFSCVIFIFE